jgi:glycosyltransferase involved in cell wall biosynthesis
MAHFKPVIALANGSNTEIIQNSENGFLYNEEDLNSAFNKLKILSDKNYREKIGKNARETVEKKFNFDTSIEKIESVIE